MKQQQRRDAEVVHEVGQLVGRQRRQLDGERRRALRLLDERRPVTALLEERSGRRAERVMASDRARLHEDG